LVTDYNFSGGLTFGGGTGETMTMNIFHSESGNTVTSSYRTSFSFGASHTFSAFPQEGRNQTTGYAYFKGGSTTVGMYNDFFMVPVNRLLGTSIYQNDAYWTGGGEINVSTSIGTLNWSYHGFTGDRPHDLERRIGDDGHPYYEQVPGQNLYNNGQTSLRLTTANNMTFGVNHIGNGVMNGQWFQNMIHDNWPKSPIPRFENSSVETLQFSFGTSGLFTN
jgi:hypothetical protein